MVTYKTVKQDIKHIFFKEHHIPFIFCIYLIKIMVTNKMTGLSSADGNVSGYRCESDCRSRSRGFNLCPVLNSRGDL